MAEADRQQWPTGFGERLARGGFQPGWAKPKPEMWPRPRITFVPAVWRYADALATLGEAAGFVSTEYAERRNLILANPIEGNSFASCRNLVAAYQLVLPGETARSHRHSPNALRFVVDAEADVYTLVEGVEIRMAPGDVLLTPEWHWHGHANHGDHAALWIDFLDVPLVQNLENMYFEHYPEFNEPVRGREEHSPFRKAGVDVLGRAEREGEARIDEGRLNTIGLHALKLASGAVRAFPPLVCNNIFAVMAGEARIAAPGIGETVLARGDVAVVPSWHAFSVAGHGEGGTLLRVTDAPVYEKLGFRDVDATNQQGSM